MSLFIDVEEIPSTDLKLMIEKSYTSFRSKHVTPVIKVGGTFTYIAAINILHIYIYGSNIYIYHHST